MTATDQKEKFKKYQGQSNWNLPNIAFMVGGFVIAAPVGIATAAWLALGKDVNIGRSLKSTYNQYSPLAREKFDGFTSGFKSNSKNDTSDNAAYQAYKAEKMAEYEAQAEQRDADAKTEEQQFNEYMSWQKQAKDEANFADFKNHLKSQDAKSKDEN
ncbi:MAG: DUF2852 domain-containing protein [Rhizobiales bacterium]|nr:DUF2852 domain-containing protein [Hyphomicrobiales bacterium]NRB14717.1 DUF2852 domain-containing protein [Hyphomicrobiales bacterium]